MRTLVDWMRNTKIKESMIYREAALNQLVFMKEEIAPLFFNWKNNSGNFDDFIKVCSSHTSKSIELPVYYIETPDIKIIARGNFHDWILTIITSVDLNIPDYFNIPDLLSIDYDDGYLGFEGMDNWRRKKYSENNREFSMCIGDKYRMYAVLLYISTKVTKA